MMKKTYINPDTKVLLVQTQQIMVTSDSQTGTKFNPNGTSSSMDARRGGSFWDDDDE